MPEQPSAEYLVQVAESLAGLAPLFVVVGGGRTARNYIQLARQAGSLTGVSTSEYELDVLGIGATRLNARLLAMTLDINGIKVPLEPPTNIESAVELGRNHDMVIMGGTVPGHTTDAVAASLAQAVGAQRLVIATNVKGVYTGDPRKDPEAEFLPELTFERLIEIVGPVMEEAGQAAVVDPVAARTAASIEGLKLAVVDGGDLENLANACQGMKFEGSLVIG